MQGLLTAVPGVKDAKVDFSAKTVTIQVDDKVDATKLTGALTGKYAGSTVKS